MAVNCTHANNPPDAKYCIDCGALIPYEGNTQRLETERLSSIHPSAWSIEDFGKPLYVTRTQLIELMRENHFYEHRYGDYVEIGSYLDNKIQKIWLVPNDEIAFSYYGREVIVIEENE